jgi:hypothetical protein
VTVTVTVHTCSASYTKMCARAVSRNATGVNAHASTCECTYLLSFVHKNVCESGVAYVNKANCVVWVGVLLSCAYFMSHLHMNLCHI